MTPMRPRFETRAPERMNPAPARGWTLAHDYKHMRTRTSVLVAIILGLGPRPISRKRTGGWGREPWLVVRYQLEFKKEKIKIAKINFSGQLKNMVDKEIPAAHTLPENLLRMMPDSLKTDIENAIKARPELFTMSEQELKKELLRYDATPTYLENILRLNFWREVDIASENGFPVIPQKNIYAGAMHGPMFRRLMKYPEKVAWMLCPIANYDTRLREALFVSTEQLRDILELPNFDKLGKLNTSLISLKLKIHQVLDIKLHGLAVQKIEQKNVNVNIGGADTKELSNMNDMEYLKTKMLELKKRKELLEKSQAPAPEPQTVEVLPNDPDT